MAASGAAKAVLFTREYPPEVYGGAGVHVEHLARELARLMSVEVRCFGAPRPATDGPTVRAYQPWEKLTGQDPYFAALEVVSVDLAMVAGLEDTRLVHSHTWYTNLCGHLAKLMYGIPHLATAHTLEPRRPWKAEQLGRGYALSCFCERTGLEAADAVIAVSSAMRQDILATYPKIEPSRVDVIHNGVDTEQYQPDSGTEALHRLGVDPQRPSVVYLGRVTRQKGIVHLLDAAVDIDPAAQLVLCAGAADTPELGREVAERIRRIGDRRTVVWIGTISRREVVQVLSHATVFCCPSIYEPLGIVNLEAMACEVPVVATTTGGIPEVVEEGETGLLVPFEAAEGEMGGPRDPDGFARGIAERVNILLADRPRAREMGRAGRRRVIEQFSWPAIARKTVALYRRLAPDLAPEGQHRR